MAEIKNSTQIAWSESSGELQASVVADSITAADIGPNAITASELANDAVDTAAIQNSAVTTAKINDGDVTEPKIASGFGLIPSGGIIMWSGSVGSVPSGWYLCDGNNGTPNLTDRFVVGAGAGYSPDDSGESGTSDGNEFNVTNTTTSDGVHSHSITVSSTSSSHSHSGTTNNKSQNTSVDVVPHQLTISEMPSHNHKYDKGRSFGADLIGFSTSSTGGNGSHDHGVNVSNPSHNHSFTTNTDGAHTHAASSANNGDHTHDVTFDVRPKFYALAFIMKA